MNNNKSEKYLLLDSYGMGPYAMKKIKVCPKCGQITPSRSLICPACKKTLIGRTLFDRYKAMHHCCSFCDIPLAKDAMYCPHCGRKVTPKSGGQGL